MNASLASSEGCNENGRSATASQRLEPFISSEKISTATNRARAITTACTEYLRQKVYGTLMHITSAADPTTSHMRCLLMRYVGSSGSTPLEEKTMSTPIMHRIPTPASIQDRK